MKVELCSKMNQWLSQGGKFPKCLEVSGPGGNKFSYEIIDRCEDQTVDGVKGRVGFKGFTLKVKDPLSNRIFAAKLCLLEDYQNEYALHDELQMAGKLSSHDSFVIHEQVGTVNGFPGQPSGTPSRWMCFISRWVNGRTLESIISSEPESLRPSLIVSVVRQLIESVLFLKEQKLKHDDLHMGNIMLESVDEIQLRINPTLPHRKLKIIDLGSLKPIDQSTSKRHDDWSWVVGCIVRLHNFLHEAREIASRHPQFLKGLQKLAELLSDPEHSRFPELGDYINYVDSLELYVSNPNYNFDEARVFSDPFEALSAEHLASDEILRQLFEDTLPWISVAKSNKPIVLTGPRGCGKSMLFKYMSAKTHGATRESAVEALKNFDFYGIYISCSSEIENDLLWMRNKDGLATDLSSSLITFFNLILAREICRSFAQLKKVEEARSILELTESNINDLSEFILSEVSKEKLKIVAREDRLSALSDVLDNFRSRVSKSMLSEKEPEISLPLTFIRDLVRFINRKFSFFRTKPISFLLDDYTSHRIGPEVQQVLNPLIWQRHSEFNFKISCEPKGFNAEGPDGKHKNNLQNLREFEVIDTSAELVSGSSYDVKKRKDFVSGLLDKRLATADYLGRTKSLIGESEYKSDLELAKAIRDRGHKSGASSYYYGVETLANCWSGDVITTLFIVERMFKAAGVTKDTNKMISKRIQHDSIRRVSTALVDRINHHYPLGEKMRTFIDGWGDLARKLLVEGPLTKEGHPYRQYRIELPLSGSTNIYQALDKVDETGLSRKILEQLVRRSVIIELPESSPKESWAQRTARFLFRASLLPKYQTSFIRENYVAIKDADEFSKFLNCDDIVFARLEARGLSRASLDSMTNHSGQKEMF